MRSRLLLALGVLVALVLAACGGSSNEAADNTTSTSEAQSPVGDQSENQEFCQQFVEQMQSIQPQAEQMQQTGTAVGAQDVATAFTELAADAPTEIQPQFEKAADAMNAIASGDPQQMLTAASEMQQAMTAVAAFLQENCPGVDVSGLTNIGGSTGGATSGTGGTGGASVPATPTPD